MLIRGAKVFDGVSVHDNGVVRIDAGQFSGLFTEDTSGALSAVGSRSRSESVASTFINSDEESIGLPGGVLCPGFVDLQVNGGGGLMFNQRPSIETLETLSKAHLGLGTTSFLPTLITDTLECETEAVDAVKLAIQRAVPGISGLHLEGPHISVTKKGAHREYYIRRMSTSDLERLLRVAAELPVLKVTLAPESVTTGQVSALNDAGVLVSLGHSDAGYEASTAAFNAGAVCVTHLFNAMSQLGSRQPGLVGAALDHEGVACGLIADGHHVSYPSIKLAINAKRQSNGKSNSKSQKNFLVSDAMAVAGTLLDGFRLQGRVVTREAGVLKLEDGTLAGADLDLAEAVSNVHRHCGVDLAEALAMATSIPAKLAGIDAGTIKCGGRANLVWLDEEGTVQRVWYAGQTLNL